MEKKSDKARQILAAIGGNVFLLTTVDFNLLSEFEEEHEKGKTEDHGSDTDWAAAGWALFFLDAGGEFDGAFDSAADAGGDGGGGCGGDSGCSGCGGCGGCGG